MSTPTTPALDLFLATNLPHYIDETARLCAIPSISAHRTDAARCAQAVADLLTRHGFDVQVFPTPGNPVVVGRLQGRSPRTLLFYNHYDVQPVDPLNLWTSPPFEPTVRDGALYARGAKDDKGELLARLAAVDAVRAAHDGQSPCGVLFVVEGEEEIGSPHIAQFVRDHLDLLASHGAIWEEGQINADGQPLLTLGRRGILYVQLEAQAMTRDAHSGSAHILPNAAWRLLYALHSLRAPDGRILIHGFYDHVQPPSPLDLELFAAEPSDEDRLRREYGVTDFVDGLSGVALKQAVFNPTCNIAGLTAGYQADGMKTVIPARATAKVDFRLVPDQDPDDILEKLRRHLDEHGFEDIRIQRLGAMWPARAPADDPLVRLTVRTGEDVYGKPSVLTPLTGGSSPVYAFARPLGIPVVSPGVGYPGSRTHAPDEHVRLDHFLLAARHIARILEGFGDL